MKIKHGQAQRCYYLKITIQLPKSMIYITTLCAASFGRFIGSSNKRGKFNHVILLNHVGRLCQTVFLHTAS